VDLSPCPSPFLSSIPLISHSHTHLPLSLNHGGGSLFFILWFFLSPQTTYLFPNSYRSTTSQVPNPNLPSFVPLFSVPFSDFIFSRARASLLQDNEEKVIVQDSFPSKSSPLHTADGNSSMDSIKTSAFEKRIIKVEQSVNIFLTVI